MFIVNKTPQKYRNFNMLACNLFALVLVLDSQAVVED